MNDLSETDIFKICERSLIHYKNKIECVINNDENKDQYFILEKFLKPKIEKINEVIEECGKDLIALKNSFDLFKPRYVASLLSYKEGLENSIQKINQLDEFPMNLEEIKEEKDNVEGIFARWTSNNYLDNLKNNNIHSDF